MDFFKILVLLNIIKDKIYFVCYFIHLTYILQSSKKNFTNKRFADWANSDK